MDVRSYVPVLSYTDETGTRTLPLTRDEITLGRSPQSDLLCTEPFVSRQHATIVRSASGFEVVDGNSTHGTFVNGKRLQRAFLQPDDVVQLGSLRAPRLHFVLQTRADPGKAAAPSPNDLLQTLTGMRPLSDEDGGAPARGLEQLNFLLTAARTLNAGGARQDILRTLLQLSIQLTGVERGFVFLASEGEMTLALGLNAEGDPLSEDATVSRRAMKGAITRDAPFTVDDTLADSAGAWSSVVLNRIRRIYCLPLRRPAATEQTDRLLGLLYLDSQIAPGHLTDVDHELLNTIATEAAALLQNALLAEGEHKARQAREELAIAARIHAGLMSITLPRLPFVELSARTVPCLAIGGDFYDAVVLPGCIGVTLADVSGKGVSSAIVAATLQGIIHAQMLAGSDLPAIASVLNRFLCDRKVGKYATLVMLKLYEDGRLEYLNCGHIQPVLLSVSSTRQLTEGNTVVGLIAQAEYTSAWDTLQPGDRLVLTTDGVTEAESADGDLFGDEGLHRAAQELSIEDILAAVRDFVGPCDAQDDYTLVEVCYGKRSPYA